MNKIIVCKDGRWRWGYQFAESPLHPAPIPPVFERARIILLASDPAKIVMGMPVYEIKGLGKLDMTYNEEQSAAYNLTLYKEE